MEIQPSIKEFFGKRKRPASTLKDIKEVSTAPSKVFVTDRNTTLSNDGTLRSKLVFPSSTQAIEKTTEICQSVNISPVNTTIEQCDRPSTPDNFISVESPVTPISIRNADPSTPSHKNVVMPARPSTPEPNAEVLEDLQKDTLSGVDHIKRKHRLNRKLQSVKKSLDTIKRQGSRLEAIQNALQNINVPTDTDRQEIISPRKLPVKQRLLFPKEKTTYSPTKPYVSPRKLLLDGPVSITRPDKIPAYKRFADLTAIEEKGTLLLPFKYRLLSEIFRAMDTIVSMIHTRGENVTFEKLQAGVQSMIKKNFTYTHLGQIKTIYPEAYTYDLEKCCLFGAKMNNPGKLELIIKPVLKNSNSESNHCSMNSALLLNRRRVFNRKLMALTKDCHEEFLLSLVPPVFIEKDKVTRWHPEFDLENVPDIEAQDVPVPKANATNTSAKQLLDRAKTLLGCNKRLSEAMDLLKEKKQTAAETNNNSNSTDKNPPPPAEPTTDSTSAISVAPALQKALRGIPKGLLEKVRARQAAKALESMTQSPSDIKEAIMLSRLPEIARMLRSLFVAEYKKSILAVDLIIERISHSYREHLSNGEIKTHLELLTKHASDWVKFQNLRNTDYLKLICKDKDINTVVADLEKVAKNKDKSF